VSSKAKILCEFLLRGWILAIIILCTSVWWAPAETLAQEAAPAASDMTAHSTLWLLEGLRSNHAPYLVIGMADRRDTPSYGSLRNAGDEATNPSVRNTISRPVGPVVSVNRAGKGDSGPLVLSSLFEPTAGVRGPRDFHAEGTIRRQTIRDPPNQAGAKNYSLLDDGPAFESLLCGYQANYLLSKQRSADN
jgi:hypothetical protein